MMLLQQVMMDKFIIDFALDVTTGMNSKLRIEDLTKLERTLANLAIDLGFIASFENAVLVLTHKGCCYVRSLTKPYSVFSGRYP